MKNVIIYQTLCKSFDLLQFMHVILHVFCIKCTFSVSSLFKAVHCCTQSAALLKAVHRSTQSAALLKAVHCSTQSVACPSTSMGWVTEERG